MVLILYRNVAAAAAAKLLQWCPTLCDPRDSRDSGKWNLGVGAWKLLQILLC